MYNAPLAARKTWKYVCMYLGGEDSIKHIFVWCIYIMVYIPFDICIESAFSKRIPWQIGLRQIIGRQFTGS